MNKKRALVVCPGRGTYNKPELGYWHHHHTDKHGLLDVIDAPRRQNDQIGIAELDSMSAYKLPVHTAGENASSLIYGCAAGDFADIDQDAFDIVAVTGNSMGWYIALALAGALSLSDGALLINTMGSMMRSGVIGGQLIYPVSDPDWQIQDVLRETLRSKMAEVNRQGKGHVFLSIDLGGYWVIAGDEKGLRALEGMLEVIDDTFPMRLFNHAAFHSPLLSDVSEQGKHRLPASMFSAPTLPLIDGEGHIWQPYSTEPAKLWNYTLGKQVVAPYHFSRAVAVGVKEFAPDVVIVLGPGTSLSGSVGQSLVQAGWKGLKSKTDFIARQQDNPLVLAMAMPEQRSQVVSDHAVMEKTAIG